MLMVCIYALDFREIVYQSCMAICLWSSVISVAHRFVEVMLEQMFLQNSDDVEFLNRFIYLKLKAFGPNLLLTLSQ